MAQTHNIAFPLVSTNREAFVKLRQSFPSHIAAVSPLVDQVMRFIARFRDPDESYADIELALQEALLNAVIHGNAEDPAKRIYVTTRCSTNGAVSITIRDEGQGFDSHDVPDPTAAENQMSSHGRGVYLIRALMDQVSFEEGGTVVHMYKGPNLPRPQSQ